MGSFEDSAMATFQWRSRPGKSWANATDDVRQTMGPFSGTDPFRGRTEQSPNHRASVFERFETGETRTEKPRRRNQDGETKTEKPRQTEPTLSAISSSDLMAPSWIVDAFDRAEAKKTKRKMAWPREERHHLAKPDGRLVRLYGEVSGRQER